MNRAVEGDRSKFPRTPGLRAGELAERAMALPSSDRESFIAREATDDPEIRALVMSLVRGAGAQVELPGLSVPARFPDSLLNGPSGAARSGGHPDDEAQPPRFTTIGPYRILRRIASGGMGVVFEAMQEHPRRTVAIKVMKRGLGSRSALRRFEHEAEVLAHLRHPHIAQVYETGMHDDGSGSVPWFAMEYIANARTITAYANACNLTVRQRLELFIKVCDAIHHGHQKGIIHRDLKPANILVDCTTGRAEPKVIDFGVARAIGSDLIATTMHTETGQLIGTVQYMSPEQCSADPDDLDTRSDVYSLGVVLYELLSGRCPYDVSHTPLVHATRIIVETQPDRLSGIDRALLGDVETIVLKALEKDRERRYQSAADLGEDIGRYLRREPIVARPASVSYQVKMFARRNRAVVIALVALFLVLIAGIVTTSVLWMRAGAARDDNARLADEAFDFTRHQLGASVALTDVQGNLTRARTLIASYEERLDGRFEDQPDLHAPIRTDLGLAYRSIGDFGKAATQLNLALEISRESLGEVHPTTLIAMIRLADVYRDMAEHEHAELMYRSAIDAVKRSGSDINMFWSCWDNLAGMLHDIGRLDEAESIYHELFDSVREVWGADNPALIYYLPLLAGVYRDQGRYAEAEQLMLDVLDRCDRQLQPGALETHRAQREFGRLYLAQGRFDKARVWEQRALEGFRSALENREDSADALMTLELGAQIDLVHGRFREAHDTFADAADRADQFLRSEQHWWAANFRTGQAICLMRMQRNDEAERMLLDAYEILEERLGNPHHRTQTCIRTIIELYNATDRRDETVTWLSRLRPASIES